MASPGQHQYGPDWPHARLALIVLQHCQPPPRPCQSFRSDSRRDRRGQEGTGGAGGSRRGQEGVGGDRRGQ